jgi:hypothetical protein
MTVLLKNSIAAGHLLKYKMNMEFSIQVFLEVALSGRGFAKCMTNETKTL